MVLFLLENRGFLGFQMIFKVWLNQIFSNFNTMLWTIKYRLSLITVYFTFTVPELWPFFLLEKRDFLGFQMIFKVWLNQIFSNFNTMLYAIKYRLSLIMVKLTFTVHESQHVSFLSLPHSKFGMWGYLWSPDQLSLVHFMIHIEFKYLASLPCRF